VVATLHHFAKCALVLAWVVAFALVGVFAAPALPSTAQTPPATCDTLQVVFIIDQSGSMSGTTGDASDPDGLRFAAPQEAIKVLSALRYSTYQTTTVQVAMVHYGDRATTALPWTTLDVTSQADTDALMSRIAPQLAPVPAQGNTNTKGAFEYAASLFDEVKPQTDGCPIRTIVAVTDGQPRVASPNFNATAHLQELIAFAQGRLPAPAHKIYVIGLDRTNEFFDDNKPLYDQLTGDASKVFKVNTPAELAAAMAQVFNPNSDSLAPLVNAGATATAYCVNGPTLQVPPYLQQVRITLIKPERTLRLDVADSTGQLLTEARTDVQVRVEGRSDNDPIEALTVLKPRPGVWTIQTQLPPAAGDVCQVRILQFNAAGKVTVPTPGQPVVQFSRTPFQMQIVDASGDVLPDYGDPQYALRADVFVQAQGMTQTLPVLAGSNFEFNGELLPLSAGPNAIHARAATRNLDGSDYVVFDQSLATLNVTPVEFALAQAPSGPIPQHKPQGFTFALTAGDAPAQIDLPMRVTATISRAGNAINLPLQDAGNGTFTAEYQPSETGDYTLAYRAIVQTPNGEAVVGNATFPLQVFPTTLVGLKFVEPQGDRFEATDFLNRPTGLPLRVQLVGPNDEALTPAEIGIADPAQAISLTVLDANQQDVSSQLQWVPAGQPGLFTVNANGLGPGQYAITLATTGELGQNYAWAQPAWTTTLTGEISRAFFMLLAGAGALAGVFALGAARVAGALRHPLTGNLALYQEIPVLGPDGEMASLQRRYLVKQALPNRNRVTLTPSDTSVIRKLIVTCESDGQSKNKQARVQVVQRSGKTLPVLLSPGLKTPVGGYYLVKDESPYSAGTSSMTDMPDMRGRS
jgi:uncharacterized protein YegL